MKEFKNKEKFIELRAEDWSFEKIAKEIKVSKQTLINWSKELKYEIANLKAIKIDALREKYFLTEKAKIEVLGERLKRLIKAIEIIEGPLGDIPLKPEHLYELFIKFYKLLQEVEFHHQFFSEKEIKDRNKLDELLSQFE